jgi:hypothetical protein
MTPHKILDLRNLIHGVKGSFVCSGTAVPENEGVVIKLLGNGAK